MPLYPIVHGQTHQEIIGSDPLVNYGLFERIRRVKRTTVNYTATMFSGVANNADNTLQTGHGWTLQNSAAGNLNYTTDFVQGTQCIKLTSDGGGVNTARATSVRETAVNLTAKMIRVWLKFDAASYANITNAFVFVGSGASQFLNFASAQIAGASMVSNGEYAKPGEWVRYTFNPASFVTITGTMDWTAVQDFRIAIKDNASGAATILFGGIDFIPNEPAYPNGVVSLTFDDSYVGPYNLARPKMEQYGYKGTFYVIQDVLGTNNSTYMTKAQLDALQTLGHEIAYHCEFVADHNATGGFTGISTAELMLNFGLEKGWMHQNGYRGVEHMALPQGLADTTLLGVLRQQFAAVRTTTFRRIETIPVADPYRLCSLSLGVSNALAVTPNTTPGTIEWYLDQIASFGGWLIIYTHDMVASGATGNQTNQASWNTMVDYVATKGIPVRTVGDVLEL